MAEFTYIKKTYKEFGHVKRPRDLSQEEKQQILQRLFEKDPSVFSIDPEIQKKVRERLDWIDGPSYIFSKKEEIIRFAEEIRQTFFHVVWCGMGGSSLFPLVLSQIFGPQAGYPQFHVLDTNDPEVIDRVEKLPLDRTIFFIVSKSGTTVETISHLKYFWEKLEGVVSNPGSHFVALTDPDSPLEKLAKELGFRKVFHHPPFVGGRYAALTEIGFLPAALLGLDLNRALSYAKNMFEACNSNIPWGYNLSATLAEYLVESYIQGQDKITFITDPLLKPFTLWLEQLLAESLGKNFTGIVPVVGESPGSPTVYGNDRAFIYLTLRGREKIYQRLITDLTEEGFKVKTYVLDEKYEIFAEVFRWMVAVALCGYFLSLNPFDEPDVVSTKQKTKILLDRFKREQDFGIDLYLDEATNLGFYYEETISIEFPRLSALLKKFFKNVSPWTYIGFLAYLPPEADIEDTFRDFRTLIREKKNCSTVFGFGPRYLHSSGQMHKGGPILSKFMIFTRKGRRENQVVPKEGYTFWDQQFAQACGDLKALVERKKTAILIHLTEDYRTDLKNFYKLLEKALSFED